MSYSTVDIGGGPHGPCPVPPPIEMQMPMLLIEGKNPNNEFRIAPTMICIEERLNAEDTRLALHLVNGEVLEIERNLETDKLKLINKYCDVLEWNTRYK